MQIRLGLPFVCGDERHVVRWTPPPALLTIESPDAYIALCGLCARQLVLDLYACLGSLGVDMPSLPERIFHDRCP